MALYDCHAGLVPRHHNAYTLIDVKIFAMSDLTITDSCQSEPNGIEATTVTLCG
jgi:hypothetical protein